jgi:lipopolysaccharide/colanic/teichoic acid biosynthesis glycosyltransferase
MKIGINKCCLKYTTKMNNMPHNKQKRIKSKDLEALEKLNKEIEKDVKIMLSLSALFLFLLVFLLVTLTII